MAPRKVTNPFTGRKIAVGKATYKRMMYKTKASTLEKKRMRAAEGLKARYPYRETRGWNLRAPRTVPEREAVFERCGSKCFLIPEERKFPVCERETRTCKADCGGLLSAKIRARQWGYWPLVGKKVEQLYKESGCSTKKTPRSPRSPRAQSPLRR